MNLNKECIVFTTTLVLLICHRLAFSIQSVHAAVGDYATSRVYNPKSDS